MAEFGLFGIGIGGRGRDTLAILLEGLRATYGIGCGFRARLHEIRWRVDHSRHVALIGAAEIVVLLVFEIALVVDRGSEIFGPQAAGPGNRRYFRIIEPDGC